MKKLLKWHEAYTLKILVSFLILFTALYPKLPSVHIIRTYVYIRLEDFFILGTVVIWFIQLFRKKVSLPFSISSSIVLYWLVGFVSLIFSIIFIGPHLTGFFPHVAFLEFLRRVEYMILFFVALSTIRKKEDIRDYFIVLLTTVGLVFLYGLGQKYYLFLWQANSAFFQKYPFCFPSFQTGNEEFAKGIPLCLPAGARITSTFGGSYDLAAYLVVVLPVIVGGYFAVKRLPLKIVTVLIFVCGLMLLIFTAQRAAFVAYIIGSIFTLILMRKRLYIIPLIAISIMFLLVFSQSTAKRFLSTFRVSSVVVDSQGKLVGEALPANLKSKIEKPAGQNLPEGSAFLGLPTQGNLIATNAAIVKKTLTPEEAKRLQLAEGTLQISTVTGSFLVRKVLVYDISFTTRFQAEWPNAWRAFLRNPFLGSGYSSITLATDNDYFRALGETGLLGLLSFIGIFVMLWITLRELGPPAKQSLISGFSYGIAGGVIGLAINATLIDVFEASKVAEVLWVLLGIGTGGLLLNKDKNISYLKDLKRILSSNAAYVTYLIIGTGAVFFSTTSNFFTADDFTWLKWAASARLSDLPRYFINSQEFFYRPLDKVITFFLYTVFSFQPQGYHVFLLFLHILAVLGVFILSKKLLKDRFLSFSVAFIFALLPAHSENILWFSGLSGVLSSVFIIYAVINFINFRANKSWVFYTIAFILTVLAFFSYEIAVITPLIFIVIDLFIIRPKRNLKTLYSHIPFLVLIPLYYLVRIVTHTFSGGGDYSYNFSHFIPNVVGNLFGYVGLFFLSDGFLPFYNSLRNSSRGDRLIFDIALLFLFITVIIIVYLLRQRIKMIFKTETGRLILFGIAFSVISLLPFLGLGNIAPRYLYLASFGFCFSLALILKQLLKRDYLVLVIIVLLAIWYQTLNIGTQNKWVRAGEITKNSLALFRIDYENLNSSDNLYFINTPVTYKNIWIFPTGISDGLWFIYHDNMPKIYQLNSVEEALKDSSQINPKHVYIFKFDSEENISRVK